MNVMGLTPILNVSNLEESFAWFERLGWTKKWDWGDPPDFGAVTFSGTEIFLCENGQGGRGRGTVSRTFGPAGDETVDRGVWMSVWVTDLDEIEARCRSNDIEITWPPTDMPWGIREMHIRHPDGHVFRLGHEVEAFDPGRLREGEPVPVERVDVSVRLEERLVSLVHELAERKGMDITEYLEETLLHSLEQVGGGVASPHLGETLELIPELKRRHGIDYDTHASYRFVEK